MGRIFRQASTVFAWIGYGGVGLADEKTTLALLYLLRISEWSKDPPHLEPEDYAKISRGFLLNNEIDWRSILHLCWREYWSRVWIIQEIVLARNIVLVWGQWHLCAKTLPWDHFSRAIYAIELLHSQGLENLEVSRICQNSAAKIERQRRAHLGIWESSDLLYDLFLVHQHLCVQTLAIRYSVCTV